MEELKEVITSRTFWVVTTEIFIRSRANMNFKRIFLTLFSRKSLSVGFYMIRTFVMKEVITGMDFDLRILMPSSFHSIMVEGKNEFSKSYV